MKVKSYGINVKDEEKGVEITLYKERNGVGKILYFILILVKMIPYHS